jgi:hypothetical protein
MAKTCTSMLANMITLAGLFGIKSTSYAKQAWYGGPNYPVYLSIFFNDDPRGSKWKRNQVIPGAAWTTGKVDPIEMSSTKDNQRVMKKRGDTTFSAWLGNSTEQYHEYTVEYYSAPR